LILYDITSSYLEGEYNNSKIVQFGYNRDKKSGHEQICIGLLCNEQGCPVAIEVFPGSTKDAATVLNKIEEIKKNYGIDEIIFVGDRGMITPLNYDTISHLKDVFVVTALTHRQIDNLLEQKTIQLGLFNENDIIEVIDPKNSTNRYCLCRNPLVAEKENKTRHAILQKIADKLNKCTAVKRKRKPEIIGKQVGKIFAKTNMEHFIIWQVIDGMLQWQFNEEAIKEAEKLDGCYVIHTNAPDHCIQSGDVVKSYKNLQLVEQAFRQLKTVLLEIRPIYHKHDERIKAHVFLCMLSYYLLWHIRQKTNSLLHQEKNKGKNRFWTVENIISRLKSICQNTIIMHGVKINQITQPDEDQQKILKLLQVKL
jgi:transposase